MPRPLRTRASKARSSSWLKAFESDSIGRAWRTSGKRPAAGAPPTRWVGESGVTSAGNAVSSATSSRNRASYSASGAPGRRPRNTGGWRGEPARRRPHGGRRRHRARAPRRPRRGTGRREGSRSSPRGYGHDEVPSQGGRRRWGGCGLPGRAPGGARTRNPGWRRLLLWTRTRCSARSAKPTLPSRRSPPRSRTETRPAPRRTWRAGPARTSWPTSSGGTATRPKSSRATAPGWIPARAVTSPGTPCLERVDPGREPGPLRRRAPGRGRLVRPTRGRRRRLHPHGAVHAGPAPMARRQRGGDGHRRLERPLSGPPPAPSVSLGVASRVASPSRDHAIGSASGPRGRGSAAVHDLRTREPVEAGHRDPIWGDLVTPGHGRVGCPGEASHRGSREVRR